MNQVKNTKRTLRGLLGGAAAITLAGLLLAPPSGWLVKAQVQMAAGMGGGQGMGQAAQWLYGTKFPKDAQRRAAQAGEVAARNPNDTALHMAAQGWMNTTLLPNSDNDDPTNANDKQYRQASTRRVEQRRALLPRFGNDPVLRAALLRDLSQYAVTLDDRDEQELLSSRPTTDPKFYEKKPGANLPENLALWEQSAQAGEKLDPQNSYFPLMHAVGLFAARRDDEALAALKRAGKKPNYNEYLSEETQGTWRLIEQAQGEPGYLARMAVRDAQLLPHFAKMRATARLATVKAMQAEMAGDKEGGFQIRIALMRVSAKMRTYSTTFIGTLVADAITPIARARPNGAPALPVPAGLTEEEREKLSQKKVNRFCDYLTTIGHGDAAGEVQFDNDAANQSRKVWRAAEDKPENIFSTQPATWIIVYWSAGITLLSNALLVLIFGTVAALLTRTDRIKNGLPLHPAVRTGLVATVFLPALWAGMSLTGPEWLTALFGVGVALPISVGVLVLMRRIRGGKMAQPTVQSLRSGFAANAGLHFATVAVGAGILGVLWLVGGGTASSLTSRVALLGIQTPDTDQLLNWLVEVLIGSAISSAVPLFLFIGLAIASRVKRVPVSVGVARGFRRFALPTASVLVLLYAGVALETLHQEAWARQELSRVVTIGEGQYLSDLLHQPWPGLYQGEPSAKGGKTK